MKKVILKKKISRRIETGHPWIFANEVELVDEGVEGGEIVEVFTYDRRFIGKGYINPKSQILVRLLTHDRNQQINDSFFEHAIVKAWEYRKQIGYVENCRLVFGEADGLPG